MLTVYNCIVHAHDLRLVALAAIICALASFAGINLLHHVRGSHGRMRLVWLGVSATATGFGIWATHFIAMLAFSPGIPSAYNVALTILSLIAAILLTGMGLAVALTSIRGGAWLGGAMVGGGIAAMHYTGMAAFEIQGHILWDPILVAASIALGGLIGAIALPVGLRDASLKCKILGALLLTAAICSHHFTAMGAAAIIPDPTVEFSGAALPAGWLAIAVAFASFVIIVLALAGVALEMRDRRRAEESFRMLFEVNPVPMFVIDCDDFKFLAVNDTAVSHYGYSREQFLAMTKLDIHQPESRQSYIEIYRAFRESGHPQFDSKTTQCHRKADGGNILVHVYGRRLNYHGRPALLCSIIDVTERKTVEDQLQQARKMEAIGNLTGGIAHDFNNLLTVIIGNLDLLQEDVAGNSAAEEKINLILATSERGADLTRDMLAFSRRQPLQAKKVDVNGLIATAMRLISRTLGENITVDVRTATDQLVVLVDPTRLNTALLNIALNARDAMPNGGTLTISTRVAELDEAYGAHHPGVAAGTYVAIEIADSGTGMPPEVLEHIFEPFFTTNATGQGTGLGLSMVYGFIKQSGGHINAYSEVGRGTVFKLFLPLASAVAQPTAAALTAPCAPRLGNNEVILAVEDNPDIRAAVSRQLRDLGYQVREADCADAALRILDAEEKVDLLFTDMIMPGYLNGKELAVRARAKRADLKVLFTSGFPGTSKGHGAQLEPGDVLLSKPYHKRDLAKAVEEVLTATA